MFLKHYFTLLTIAWFQVKGHDVDIQQAVYFLFHYKVMIILKVTKFLQFNCLWDKYYFYAG